MIGLTNKQYLTYDPPGWSEESIGYSSYGTIQLGETSEKVGSSWEEGDVVECGITFSQNLINDRSGVIVNFFKKWTVGSRKTHMITS